MSHLRRVSWRATTLLIVFSLVATSCSSSTSDNPDTTEGSSAPVMVAPNTQQETMVLNVALSPSGFEPETIFLPAGRHVKLVVRNHSDVERHYRIVGLIPAQLGWHVQPVITEDEMESMTPEQLEQLGITGEDMSNLEHSLHHLSPTFLPFKPESRAGIRPLPNEVHAYVYRGVSDIVTFYPLSVGEFVVEDPLHPEITGRVVVFDPGT